tara:strand:+ start:1701 stop:2261 length:561 start_codon:yes stop_codon:yes gene_type:complete
MDQNLKKSINIFNNSFENECKLIKNNSFSNDLIKQKKFVETVVNLNNYLNIIFKLKNKIVKNNELIIYIVENKIGITKNSVIYDNINDFLLENNIKINKNNSNFKYNYDIFIRKCHNDNILDYNYCINFNYNYPNTFLYYFIENYYDLKNDTISNYEEYMEYLFYWLKIDSNAPHIHYYKQKHLII